MAVRTVFRPKSLFLVFLLALLIVTSSGGAIASAQSPAQSNGVTWNDLGSRFPDGSRLSAIVMTPNGKIVGGSYGTTVPYVYTYDLKTGLYSDNIPVPGTSAYVDNMTFGDNGLVYLTTSKTYGQGSLVEFNPETGDIRSLGSFGDEYGQGIAVGPDGSIYVSTCCAGKLSIYNPQTAQWNIKSFLLSDQRRLGDLVFGNDGNLYGVTERIWISPYGGAILFKYNPATQVTTRIGTIATGARESWNIVKNPRDGKLYGSVGYGMVPSLWVFDPSAPIIPSVNPIKNLGSTLAGDTDIWAGGMVAASDGKLYVESIPSGHLVMYDPFDPSPTMVDLGAANAHRPFVMGQDDRMYAALGTHLLQSQAAYGDLPREPIMLLPGIGGSELKTNQLFYREIRDGNPIFLPHWFELNEEIWLNETMAGLYTFDNYFDVLAYDRETLTPIVPSLYPSDLLHVDIAPDKGYRDWPSYFTSIGYSLNKDLGVFPYDFREDISKTADRLDKEIQALLEKANNNETNPALWRITKVNLIAHSMGSIVAKEYIRDPENTGRAQKVHRVIALAPPYLGAPKMSKAILYGYDFDTWGALNEQEVKEVMQNWPGAYQLAPSEAYYSFYNHLLGRPDPYFQKGPLDYHQSVAMLSNLDRNKDGVNDYNTTLLKQAEELHSGLDVSGAAYGPEVYVLAGNGDCTIGQIKVSPAINILGFKVDHYELTLVNGDGTVPIYSSLLYDQANGLDLRDKNPGSKTYYSPLFNHNSIKNDDKTGSSPLLFVKNILEGNNAILPGWHDINDGPPFDACYGKFISVASPVELHVYDAQGRHTGTMNPSGVTDEEIPGSWYEEVESSKFVYLPDEGAYTIRLNATDSGEFTLKLQTYEGDQVTKTISYLNVPLTTTTKGSIVIDPAATTPPVIQLDYEGDGVVDEERAPSSTLSGSETSDLTPPVIAINSPLNNGIVNNPISLSWAVTDTETGVLRELAVLDEGTLTAQNITNNPTIQLEPGEHALKVAAQDRAGNGEAQTVNFIVNDTPSVTTNQDAVSVDEGGLATNAGTWSDRFGDTVTLSASIGTVIKENGTWSWSFHTTDGPAESQNVTITADDGKGGVSTTSFVLTVRNVAPTATFGKSNTGSEGSPFTLELTNPSDPSSVDTAEKFTYEFNCGDGAGYIAVGTSNTISCHTFDNGVRSVGGKIIDKDGSVSEYSVSVTVNNGNPVAAVPSWSNASVACRTSATLKDISFSDPGMIDYPWNININWGDGSPETNYNTNTQGVQSNQSHTYTTPGIYQATIGITDKDNGSGYAQPAVNLTVLQTYTINFSQPLDGSTPSSLITNTMKSGRVVPVKVTIYDDCAQAYVTDPATLVKISLLASGSTAANDAVEVYADAGASNNNTLYFRWTSDYSAPGGGFWIYNLDSKTALNNQPLVVNTAYRVDVYIGSTKVTATKWVLLKPVK